MEEIFSYEVHDLSLIAAVGGQKQLIEGWS